MDTINEWLENGKDYNTGLALLMKHSKNRVLLQTLSRKNIPAKLEYELRKINGNNLRESIPVSGITPLVDSLKMVESPKVDPADLPDHLKILWDETAEKYRLSRATHEQIKQMTDAKNRAAHIEILENYRQEIRANWGVIDDWVKGRNTGINSDSIDDKRISANRKYLSEGKKNLEKLNGAIRAKKLEAMQRRINELLLVGEKFEAANQKELEELDLKFNG